MKPSAAEPRLRKHRGKAMVFRDYNHMAAEIERDDLDVTPDHVLVLQNAGPKGGPGMPEWGMLPIPRKLVKAGVRDMLRISDARMSGTSYGACILHVAPESFVGGRWHWWRPATRSRWTWPSAGCTCTSPTRSWPAAAPSGWRRRRATSAATAACSRSTSARPTTAATSISWSTARSVPEPEIH